MTNTKRVLVCANPDLNYIDGSSIWAQTITLATAATGQAKVDFIAKSRPERDELYAPLKQDKHITIIDGTDKAHWAGKAIRRLNMEMMAELAVALDVSNPYDVIIVRGFEIAANLLRHPDQLCKTWLYLTDIPQTIAEYTPEQRYQMQCLAQGCARLLCQTQGFMQLWQVLASDVAESKLTLYTPVIPDIPEAHTPIAQRPKRAVYAGKFAADWMTLEMAQLWPEINKRLTDGELVMIGDKIHNESYPKNYMQRMREALENTPGLVWLGAQSRESVQQTLQQARVGLSWRTANMDDTVEYSTKILEYGGAGCAAILNRNALHEQLLGVDYPLYANTEQEYAEQLYKALTDDTAAQDAANRLTQLALLHTFSARMRDIKNWLAPIPGKPLSTAQKTKKTTVLVAGHDLKFFKLLQRKLEATGQFNFLVDQWQGHNKHDATVSLALLEKADVIFCEWCLGNLKWYSHNKKSHQRLVARFHAQEARSAYMAEANWDQISLVSFVSEHTQQEALNVFSGFPIERTLIIPNYLDEQKFTLMKKTGDAHFTLGMIGVTPKSKRLDRALDLLEELLTTDIRYCLRVKGKNPLDYDWLLNREDELTYYSDIYKRINSNPKLRNKVIFDPAGNDVNEWFTMIGYILSPSDFESFHMAVGEGMLTGSIPVVWNWKGSNDIWPSKYIIPTIKSASELILGNHDFNKPRIDLFEKHDQSYVIKRFIEILKN